MNGHRAPDLAPPTASLPPDADPTPVPGTEVGGRVHAPRTRRPAGGLRLTWCRDEREFAALADEWDRLYASCATATPFQSHAWLHSWWLSYGRPGRLRLALVREGARLRAVAPMTAVPGPVPSLVLLGGPVSDFGDVLVDGAHRERAVRLLADGLARAARTRLVDLGEVRPGAAAELVHAAWPGPRRALDDSLCLHLPAAPLDTLLERLARPRAQRFRAKLRKIEALGVQRRTVAESGAGEAVRALLRLHRLQWQGRGVTPEHLTPRFAAHLERAAPAMVRAGQARLTEFRLDGELVAVDLTLVAPHLTGGYLYGADPRLRERRIDVATMLLDAATSHFGEAPSGERAAGEGEPVLSLLRGNEPYKHHWRPEPTTNRRLLLASRATAPLLGAVLLDAAARRRAKAARERWRERSVDRGAVPDGDRH